MVYTEELKEILKKQEFKNFWQLLDYLLLAGYKPIDAFGISLKEFSDKEIWEHVAFARLVEWDKSEIMCGVDPCCISGSTTTILRLWAPVDRNNTQPLPISRLILNIGVLNDETNHLSLLFDTYKKYLLDNNTLLPIINELEELCNIYKIKDIPLIILQYLTDSSIRYYGYDIMVRPTK